MANNLFRYVMKGINANSPNGDPVSWSVNGTPDFTGQYSGYGAGQVLEIGIDYIIDLANSVQYNNPTGPATGDLDGYYPAPTVDGLQGIPVSPTAPTANQVLIYNGTAWTPTNPTSGPPSGTAGGDLSGTYPNPVVAKLQTIPVSATPPTTNQILLYNGSVWIPANNTNSFTAGTDLSGTNTNQTVIGLQGHAVNSAAPSTNQVLEWNGTSWIPTNLPAALPPNGSASGDLGGSYPNPTVVKLQTRAMAATAPTLNQVLQWNGTTWLPASLTSFPPNGAAGGDLGGTYPNPSVNKLQTIPVNATAPTNGQLLTYDSADGYWHAATLAGLPPTGSAGGDLSGTYPNPAVIKLQGTSVSATSPTSNQVLAFNGSAWIPTTNTATASGPAGGDLTGTYPNPTVIKINGNAVATQTLDASFDGYALTWDFTDGYWKAQPATGGGGGGSPTGPAGGDLTGSYPNPLVATSGGNPIITSNTFAGGDLGNQYPNPTVNKIKGHAVATQTFNSSFDGYVLTWDNTDGYWKAEPPTGSSFTAGTDLSGTSTNQTVIGIQTHAVPAPSGSNTTLVWSGSAFSWGTGSVNFRTVSSVKTSNYTTTSDDIVPYDTTSGSFTLTLDVAPTIGVTRTFMDVGLALNANPITISGNGFTIITSGGKVPSFNLNTPGVSITLIYLGNPARWSILSVGTL